MALFSLSQLLALAASALLLSSFPAVMADPPANTTVGGATLLSVAQGAGLKQLVAAISAVGGPLLAAVQNSSTSVTVFAPTDAVR